MSLVAEWAFFDCLICRHEPPKFQGSKLHLRFFYPDASPRFFVRTLSSQIFYSRFYLKFLYFKFFCSDSFVSNSCKEICLTQTHTNKLMCTKFAVFCSEFSFLFTNMRLVKIATWGYGIAFCLIALFGAVDQQRIRKMPDHNFRFSRSCKQKRKSHAERRLRF